MTPTIKMNFPSDVIYAQSMWKCSGCQDTSDLGNRDTQQHVMSCLGYEKFRKDKDLSIDKDIVQYFKEIIQNREDNE